MKNRLFILGIAVVLLVGLSGACGNGGTTAVSDGEPSGVEVNDTNINWVAKTGSDETGIGTFEKPFLTVSKAIASSNAEGGVKDVHVVAGNYDETAVIGDAVAYYGIALRGGYAAVLDANGMPVRDIANNISHITKVVIDGSYGASLTGKEAIVEGLNLSQLEIVNASPEIVSNMIMYDSSACVGGAALKIMSSAANSIMPALMLNEVKNVDCLYSAENSLLLAVELISSDASQLSPSLSQNTIVGGSVAGADAALAFAAKSSGTSTLQPMLTSNLISAGPATFYSAGLNLWADDTTSIATVSVEANEISAGTASLSMGVDLGYDAVTDIPAQFTSADIKRNKISAGDQCDWSVALSLANASATNMVVNNFLGGGSSSVDFALVEGIVLDFANADVINNTMVSDSVDTAIVVDLVEGSSASQIENNILQASGAFSIGVLEAPDAPPAEFMSNLFGTAVDVLYSSFIWGDLTTIVDLELAYPTFLLNLVGDALLVDATNMNLHIGAGSVARNAGSAALAPAVDIDGDVRPMGASVDIGADEFLE